MKLQGSWNRRVWAILALVTLAVLGLAGVILASNQDDDTVFPTAVEDVSSTTVALGPGFALQGQLADEEDGTPLNGPCDLRFGLFDMADGGSKLGEVQRDNVSVVRGIFAVNLDFDPRHFSGEGRWLQIDVRCPAGGGDFLPAEDRHELAAVPYALGLRPGARIIGSVPSGPSVDAGLKVFNSSTTYPIGLYGIVNVPTGPAIGVAGNNSSPAGHAVYGYSSPTGTGVRGEAIAGAGVWGSSVDWVGAYGYSAKSIGVMGESPNGGGVFGKSTKWRGVTGESVDEHGVYGTSTNGAGVAGVSQNWAGVRGVSNSPTNGAVSAQNNGSGPGIYATSQSGPAAVFAGTTRTEVLQITGGSDLAERFQVSDGATAEPGTVMVIDPDNPGHLMISTAAYDRKVAGVISGAGDVATGLVLHQEGVLEGDAVVAIGGRVYVKAEAISGPIMPGDLLTTSDMAGYAMAVTDFDQAHGAIIGKAMTALDSGTGLVLVLVNLQ